MGALDDIGGGLKKTKDSVASSGTAGDAGKLGKLMVSSVNAGIQRAKKIKDGEEISHGEEISYSEISDIKVSDLGAYAPAVKHHMKLDAKSEIKKIIKELDDGEIVAVVGRQSRGMVKSGATKFNPKSMFLTNNRILIRQPTRFGTGEKMEAYDYDQIKSVRVERGMRASSIILNIDGLTELSKLAGLGSGGFNLLGGMRAASGKGVGEIGGLDRALADEMHKYIKARVDEIKKMASIPTQTIVQQQQQDPIAALKLRFVNGEITEDEYMHKKELLES